LFFLLIQEKLIKSKVIAISYSSSESVTGSSSPVHFSD